MNSSIIDRPDMNPNWLFDILTVASLGIYNNYLILIKRSLCLTVMLNVIDRKCRNGAQYLQLREKYLFNTYYTPIQIQFQTLVQAIRLFPYMS